MFDLSIICRADVLYYNKHIRQSVFAEKTGGNPMVKRILSMLLAVALVIGVLPLDVFAEGTAQKHTKYETLAEHDSSKHVCEHCVAADETITAAPSWIAWGDDSTEKNLPTAAGHYYLTRNMDVQKVDLTADVVLCLNGKTVTCAGTYTSASDRFYYLKGTKISLKRYLTYTPLSNLTPSTNLIQSFL